MNEKMIKSITLIARLLLGVVFVFSGFVKAIDPLGTTYKIEDYLFAFGDFFITFLPLAQTLAILLIAVEFTLGVCLLLNVRPKLVAWITFAFYCVMTPLTLYIAVTNPISDCGCFGEVLVISNTQTFVKNVILLSCAIFLIYIEKKNPSQNPPILRDAIATATPFVVILLFMWWTLLHLPIADFRPYKIGNNIIELMEYPDDAEPDEYETTLIYADQNGNEKEFTINNYPKEGGWTFVRQNSKLVKKGYEPPIHDFEITTEDLDVITYDILTSEVPVHLVIMYNLQKSNMKLLPKIRALFEECTAKGEPVYLVTSSLQEDIELLQSQLEVALPICFCDPITLKTIVRANPGVMVVKDGVIIDKYNLRNR